MNIRQEVCDIASDYAVKLGKRQSDKSLTLNCFRRFIKSWPELRVLKPRSLEVQRAKCTTFEMECLFEFEIWNEV